MSITSIYIPFLFIVIGILLRLSLIPNTKRNNKLGLALIIIGSINLVLLLLLYIVKN